MDYDIDGLLTKYGGRIMGKSNKGNEDYIEENQKLYMEGVMRQMIDSGIDPSTNNPEDYIYYQEMAGRIPGQVEVDEKEQEIMILAVGGDETGGVAHFHVFRSEKDLRAWKNGACIMFKENKYFDHGDNSETLTKDEMSAMVKCLKSVPDTNLPGSTYWQYLIYLWNGNNFDYSIDINTPMPDYDYRTIERYSEGE